MAKVQVHHPRLGRSMRVTRDRADLLAASGWQIESTAAPAAPDPAPPSAVPEPDPFGFVSSPTPGDPDPLTEEE